MKKSIPCIGSVLNIIGEYIRVAMDDTPITKACHQRLAKPNGYSFQAASNHDAWSWKHTRNNTVHYHWS